MTTPVSFDLAKLLREKGFDKEAKCYHSDGTFQDRQNLYNYNDSMFQHGEDYLISAPTIAQVVMWLYEKHKLFITLYPYDEFREDLFSFLIIKRSGNYRDKFPYNTPTQAYEAAIEYCLTNLI